MFTIYRVTNTVNEEKYVGFTSENPPKNRWVAHQYLARKGSKTHFHCAIRKYGAETFKWEILEMGENEEYGKNVAEPMYIAWLKPEYNKTKGGDGVVGYKHTPEHCRAQSERKRGKKYALGYKHTEDTKQIITEAGRNRKLTPEQIQSISTRMMGKKMGLGHKKSEECKRLMSVKMSTPIRCPHCHLVGGKGAMHRWHFDNCRKKVI